MSWNPEGGTPLSSPAINIAEVEASSMRLWEEFLSGYFDGGQHMLRGVFTPFPQCQKISFQEQNVQPTDGLYLQLTLDRPGLALKRLWPGDEWVITERARIHFWIRCNVKGARPDGHNSHSLARAGADTLFAILESNILTEPLARRGMGTFVPIPPVVESGGGPYSMRRVSLNVTYTYKNQESTMTTVPSVSTDASLQVVYIGANKTVRVTPNGYERKGPDGNWYIIDVELLQGDTGIVPTTKVTPAP